MARLRTLAQRLEVGERVRVLGAVPRSDLPALIRSADVVTCLPWYQLSVRGALEALACGRPIVAAASGGLLDVVDEGVTGLLVEPQSPSAGALAVRRLLAAAGLRQTMGEHARLRAQGAFDWRHVAGAAEAVYNSMRADAEPRGIRRARVAAPRAGPWHRAGPEGARPEGSRSA